LELIEIKCNAAIILKLWYAPVSVVCVPVKHFRHPGLQILIQNLKVALGILIISMGFELKHCRQGRLHPDFLPGHKVGNIADGNRLNVHQSV